MSIISVMAAFIVLLIGIMMTTTAMTAALRIMQDSNENRIITENAVEYYYTGSGEGTLDSQYIMQDFIFTSNNGGKNFSIKGNVGQQYNYNEAVKSQYKTYRFFAFDKRKFTGEKRIKIIKRIYLNRTNSYLCTAGTPRSRGSFSAVPIYETALKSDKYSPRTDIIRYPSFKISGQLIDAEKY